MGVRNNTGQWTREEHEAFLRAVQLFGQDWQAMETLVPTRTSVQIRANAQTYFAKADAVGTFPGQPYPSQFSVEAGGSGVQAGAHVYRPVQQQRKEDPGLLVRTHSPFATAATEPTGSAISTDAGVSLSVPPAAASFPPSAYGDDFEIGSSGGGGGGGGRGGGSDGTSRSAASTSGTPACRRQTPNPTAPTRTMLLIPPVASASPSNLGPSPSSSGSTHPYGLADRPAAGGVRGEPILAAREDDAVPATHGGSCGGGGGPHRSGGVYREQRGLDELLFLNAPLDMVDRMRSQIPRVEEQQRHHRPENQLQHLLLWGTEVPESNDDPGCHLALEDLTLLHDWTRALGDDGRLFEIDSWDEFKLL